MELCGCVCMCVIVHIMHRSVYGTFSFMWRVLRLLFLARESVICPIGAVVVKVCSFCIYFYVLLILFIYLFIFWGVIINVMNGKLCVQEVLTKFYPFIPLLVTLALLQSHSDMGLLTQ